MKCHCNILSNVKLVLTIKLYVSQPFSRIYGPRSKMSVICNEFLDQRIRGAIFYSEIFLRKDSHQLFQNSAGKFLFRKPCFDQLWYGEWENNRWYYPLCFAGVDFLTKLIRLKENNSNMKIKNNLYS